MPLFSTRTATAVDDREQVLNEEIARLEKEIAVLKAKPRRPASRPTPSVQTSQISGTSTPVRAFGPPLVTNVVPMVSVEAPVVPVPLPPAPPPQLQTTVLGITRAKSTLVPIPTPAITDPRYNELGERKFDLGSWWGNLRHQMRRQQVGPANPEMIKYLATGSVQGLRPLRYERRIARNRTIGLVTILVVVLYGLAWVFFRR